MLTDLILRIQNSKFRLSHRAILLTAILMVTYGFGYTLGSASASPSVHLSYSSSQATYTMKTDGAGNYWAVDKDGKIVANSMSTSPSLTLEWASDNANGGMIFVGKDCGTLDTDNLKISLETYFASDGATLNLTRNYVDDSRFSVEVEAACPKCTFEGFTFMTSIDLKKWFMLCNSADVWFKKCRFDVQAGTSSYHDGILYSSPTMPNCIHFVGCSLVGGKSDKSNLYFSLASFYGVSRLEVLDLTIEHVYISTSDSAQAYYFNAQNAAIQYSGEVTFQNTVVEFWSGFRHSLCFTAGVKSAKADNIIFLKGDTGKVGHGIHTFQGYQLNSVHSRIVSYVLQGDNAGSVDVSADSQVETISNVTLPYGRLDCGTVMTCKAVVVNSFFGRLELSYCNKVAISNSHLSGSGTLVDLYESDWSIGECNFRFDNVIFDLSLGGSSTHVFGLIPDSYNIRTMKFNHCQTIFSGTTDSWFFSLSGGVPHNPFDCKMYFVDCDFRQPANPTYHNTWFGYGTRYANIVDLSFVGSRIVTCQDQGLLGQWGVEAGDRIKNTQIYDSVTGNLVFPN